MTLPENLPRGTQVVSYRIVSADGHPVAGSLVFSIGEMTKAAVTAPPASSVLVSALIWLARVGVYLGLFVGVGGAFFAAWIGQGARWREGDHRRTADRHCQRGGLARPAGHRPLEPATHRYRDPGALESALATSLGPSLLIAIAAMAIAYFARWSPSIAISRGLTSAAMVGVGLSLASSGHAATAPPQWLTRPSLFLHGVGVAYWVGALAPLAAMAWRRSDALPRVLHRFSALAVPVVGVLVLTGLGLAVVQLESFGALIETAIRHHPAGQAGTGGAAAGASPRSTGFI